MDLLLNTSKPAVVGAHGEMPWQIGPDGRINLHANRPFYSRRRRQHGYLVPRANGNGHEFIRVNASLLQYQEWLDIDRTVIEVATERLTAVSDLMARGLTHSLGSIGLTISQWDKQSDMTPADVNMSGVTAGQEDTPAYDQDSVPIPIVHKDFRLDVRRLEASRRFGSALDVTAADIAGRLVAEASEDMLFSGNAIQVEGGTIYGYTNHPNRNTYSIGVDWASATPKQIFDDVQAMLQAARDDRFFGPFCLYIPGEYEGVLDEDYIVQDASPEVLVTGSRTIRERLLALKGLQEIKVADRLTTGNVVLVQLTRNVVDLAIAQGITTIQYTNNGGMSERFKTMAVWAPRLKTDYDGRMGLVHGSV